MSFVLCDIVTVLFTLPRAMYYKGVVILTSRIAVFAVVISAVVSISFPEYPSCSFQAADQLYFVNLLPRHCFVVRVCGKYVG